jgi:hypothetical protein
MENNLKKGKRKNGRQAQQKRERKTTSTKQKVFSRFLLNPGANLSWGWLSSLRFLLYITI